MMMKRKHAFLLFSNLALAISLSAQINFTNQTNLLFNSSGFNSGVAVAVVDMNNDGKDDVVRLQDGDILNVEYQQGSGDPFSHATLAFAPNLAWAMAVADVNNDGFGDVLFGGAYDGVKVVKSDNGGNNYFLSTLPGPGVFVQGSNFADIDNDGALDVFTCHDDGESRIWSNNGNGVFSEADNWINMATNPPSDNSGNYGSVWTDFDNDGDLDLYIAKCRIGVFSPNDPRRINALFVNDGNGNFTENAEEYGLKIGHQSWTADFQDIDNDGDLDCFIVNHDSGAQLLENIGSGYFIDISASSGVGNIGGQQLQGIMRDFDNDGFVDILVAASTALFLNNGDKTFSYASIPFAAARTFATGDLNHDGFLDLYTATQCNYTTPCGQADQLWMNDGNDNHFLAVRLQGTLSNYKGVGARVEIYGSWGVQIREIRAGESYGISNTLTAHFGLGTATSVDSVIVHWPSGQMDMVNNPAIDAFLLIEEGLPCAAPDVTLQVNDFACENGGAHLHLTLCNQGFSEMPTGLPLSFYKNDPRQAGATFLASGQTDMAVAAGECQSFSFSVEAILDAPVFAVANEDGTSSLPFNLPAGPEEECDYSNNFTSADLNYQAPVLDLGSDLNLCNVPLVQLDAGNEFFSYTWQDGSSESNFTVNNSGTFWINVMDICGLPQADSVFVSITQVPPIELGDDRQICASENTTLTVFGYSEVQWSPPTGLSCTDCPSTVATPASTTTYQVTATEGNCVSTDEIQVAVNAPPTVNMVADDGFCSMPAAIFAEANGNGPFSYSWSSGESDAEINPTFSGTYTVTVEDNNGCQTIESATVTVYLNFDFGVEVTNPICPGEATGSIEMSVSGSVAPYNFDWSNGAETEDLNNIPAGIYTLTVSDAVQCTAEVTVEVEEPDIMFLVSDLDEVLCNGGTGNIYVDIINGVEPYSYLWSTGAETQHLVNIPAGSYSLTVTDANQCAVTTSFMIWEPDPTVLQADIASIECADGTGSILLDITGGTPPFQFVWSNGAVTQNLENVPAGNYSLTMADANQCITSFSQDLEEPDALLIQHVVTEIQCAGEMGSILLDIAGGAQPYSYLWSNGAVTQNLENVPAGNYSLTLTDANQCSSTFSENLNEPEELLLSGVWEDLDCSGLNPSAMANLHAIGGTSPYQFLWENGSTDTVQFFSTPGVYIATLTDVNGCETSTSATIGLTENLLTNVNEGPISCHPDNGISTDGWLEAQPISGTAPFQFLWSTGDADSTISNLTDGTYLVTVTDAIGCSGTFGYLMENPALMSTAVVAMPSTICPGEFSSATSQTNGGKHPLQFLWNTGDTLSTIKNLSSGDYFVTVTDDNGCTSIATSTITSSPPIEIQLDSIIAATSVTNADGAILLDAISGGSPPFDYLWSNGDTTLSLSNIVSGNYQLTVTDAEGCQQIANFDVDVTVAAAQLSKPNWSANLFPNPASRASRLQLSIQSPIAIDLNFQLFDTTGRLLIEEWLEMPAGLSQHKITLPALAGGLYFVRLVDETGRGRFLKLVVE